ncbi:MAG: hypothetical protein ACI9XK_004699, partial [Granulosicoccus sp.]
VVTHQRQPDEKVFLHFLRSIKRLRNHCVREPFAALSAWSIPHKGRYSDS